VDGGGVANSFAWLQHAFDIAHSNPPADRIPDRRRGCYRGARP